MWLHKVHSLTLRPTTHRSPGPRPTHIIMQGLLLLLLFTSLTSTTSSGPSRSTLRESIHDFGQNLSIQKTFKPNWRSLDSRPLPLWYDEAKIGIFIHWGVFSVPSFIDAWFWYWWKGPQPREEFVEFMKKNYRPGFLYQDFAVDFTAQLFDPYHWADVFQASGAKYVVLTTKHHEGFCLWPSNHSWNWNAMDVGPKRDLVGELANAIRNSTAIKFGVYHSLYEFFNPLLMQDHDNDFKTQDYVMTKSLPELYELVEIYKPEVVWSDGPWKARDTYWKSKEFLAWLYNDSPVKDTVVTNDRWGRNTVCKHGGYLTCKDHFNPKKLMHRKFEDSTTITRRGYSFRRNMNLSEVHTMERITELIAEVVSCGGNLLLNIGPTKDGIIVPVFEERLRQMGLWLGVNGEGIYATKPWTFQNDISNKHVWYTQNGLKEGKIVYAIVLKWPDSRTLHLGAPLSNPTKTSISLLGYPHPFKWHPTGNTTGIDIDIPVIGFQEMPCQWAWVFKLTNIQN